MFSTGAIIDSAAPDPRAPHESTIGSARADSVSVGNSSSSSRGGGASMLRREGSSVALFGGGAGLAKDFTTCQSALSMGFRDCKGRSARTGAMRHQMFLRRANDHDPCFHETRLSGAEAPEAEFLSSKQALEMGLPLAYEDDPGDGAESNDSDGSNSSSPSSGCRSR